LNGLMVRIKKRTKKAAGFTLIEIVIAVLILSSALITLLGLQSSILKRALRDEEKQQAMLLARTILSTIEVKNRDIENQDSTSSVDELMDKLQVNIKDEAVDYKIKKFEFMARLKVEDVGIKDVGEKLMKSVTLTIYTKEAELTEGNPLDAFQVTYLIAVEDV
jgi:prepilin-type N-terminal cleavage/methylation domain-containing protein